jgi:chromosome condensin MukBEF complex kleisin-like MukF subunit
MYLKLPFTKPKKFMYQALVQSILLYVAETWTLNTEQANKLLATEMDFWRRSARKSRKEKVRNVTIREVMEVRKNILEVIEEKPLRWFRHVKRMPGNLKRDG